MVPSDSRAPSGTTAPKAMWHDLPIRTPSPIRTELQIVLSAPMRESSPIAVCAPIPTRDSTMLPEPTRLNH